MAHFNIAISLSDLHLQWQEQSIFINFDLEMFEKTKSKE